MDSLDRLLAQIQSPEERQQTDDNDEIIDLTTTTSTPVSSHGSLWGRTEWGGRRQTSATSTSRRPNRLLRDARSTNPLSATSIPSASKAAVRTTTWHNNPTPLPKPKATTTTRTKKAQPPKKKKGWAGKKQWKGGRRGKAAPTRKFSSGGGGMAVSRADASMHGIGGSKLSF